MYLRGLGATGTDPNECRARGGIPRLVGYREYRPAGGGVAIGTSNAPEGVPGTEIYACDLPAQVAAPAAPSVGPINTVSISVPTQVSPQVSPVFVQQDQPQNSPVTAAPVSLPSQSNTPAATFPASPAPDYNAGAMEAARIREENARAEAQRIAEENDWLRAQAAQRSPASVATVPAQSQPLTVYAGGGGAVSPVPAVADGQALPAAAPMGWMDYLVKYSPAIIATVAVAGLLANRKKRRR